MVRRHRMSPSPEFGRARQPVRRHTCARYDKKLPYHRSAETQENKEWSEAVKCDSHPKGKVVRKRGETKERCCGRCRE